MMVVVLFLCLYVVLGWFVRLVVRFYSLFFLIYRAWEITLGCLTNYVSAKITLKKKFFHGKIPRNLTKLLN